MRVRRALLSVSDKTGVVELAEDLVEMGVELVSTGGTARALADAGVGVRAIEDFTGFPEMMDGRVKTLHPRLYAGLLAVRDDDSHLKAAAEHEIEPVDLVCVNLYPFEQTVARGDASDAEIVENIDIGGPTMIRAAAKNHAFAVVLVDPADYAPTIAELRESGGRLSMATRERLAGKAFAMHRPLRRRDLLVVRRSAPTRTSPPSAPSPTRRRPSFATARTPTSAPPTTRRWARPRICSRASPSCTARSCRSTTCSICQRARELVEDFSEPACAIVKHNNPCGCALGKTALDAYERAFACDPQSAFGGVIALNRPVDLACAEALSNQFVEVLLAPRFDPDALAVLTEKKNVRLLELPSGPSRPGAWRVSPSSGACSCRIATRLPRPPTRCG